MNKYQKNTYKQLLCNPLIAKIDTMSDNNNIVLFIYYKDYKDNCYVVLNKKGTIIETQFLF